MYHKNESPLVTIALPVFNEEKHISETLKTLSAQNYYNLEIIISDNCSTDTTALICKEYVQKDPRITLYSHEKNVGLTKNYAYVFEKAKGHYIMFAEGHNMWSNNLVSQCISLLENHKTATIAFGTPIWIDDHGNIINKYSGWYDTRGLNPVSRFFMVFWGSMMPQLGIIKREDIPDLKYYNFPGADLVVLSKLALKGEFIHAENTYFYRRQIRPPETHKERMKRYKSSDVQIAKTALTRLFPLARLPVELCKAVLQAPISRFDKLIIFILLLPSLPFRYLVGKKHPESIKPF